MTSAASRADNDSGNVWVAEHEPDGSSADRHVITCAHDADALRSIQQAGGRGGVVIARTGVGVGEYPAVEDARGEHRDATPLAGREQEWWLCGRFLRMRDQFPDRDRARGDV